MLATMNHAGRSGAITVLLTIAATVALAACGSSASTNAATVYASCLHKQFDPSTIGVGWGLRVAHRKRDRRPLCRDVSALEEVAQDGGDAIGLVDCSLMSESRAGYPTAVGQRGFQCVEGVGEKRRALFPTDQECVRLNTGVVPYAVGRLFR